MEDNKWKKGDRRQRMDENSEIWKSGKRERKRWVVAHLVERKCLKQHMNALYNSCKKKPDMNCEYKRIQKVAISCLFEALELRSMLPELC
jgi:hypothetical protein